VALSSGEEVKNFAVELKQFEVDRGGAIKITLSIPSAFKCSAAEIPVAPRPIIPTLYLDLGGEFKTAISLYCLLSYMIV
jgi:hypothetical protein